MSIKDIRLFGDPVLRTPAAEVVDFDKELRVLVKDLQDTMLDAPGAGLAAPQIGVGLRVFTYWVDGVLGHLVNPMLDLSDERAGRPRGLPVASPGSPSTPRAPCASWPRVRTCTASRSSSRASELLARCVQHETDHLDGILFVDRMDPDAAQAGDEGHPRGRVGRRSSRPRSGSARTRPSAGGCDVRLVFAGTPEVAVPSLDAARRLAPRGRRRRHPSRRAGGPGPSARAVAGAACGPRSSACRC